MKKIELTDVKLVKFIKLGGKGKWEADCIEGSTPSIRLGFNNPYHKECLAGEWEKVEEYFKDKKTTNLIKKFYTLSSSAMWITFYKKKLYWCFADENVEQLDDGSRIRKVKGEWSSKNIQGDELYVENLSGKLTKVKMHRSTMCNVREKEYLISKINAEELPEIETAKKSLDSLIEDIKPLIKNLTWHDFELLTDLVFSRAGWQRISTLGKTEESIDLDVITPITKQRAFVQVKSQSTKNEFAKYRKAFKGMKQYGEMYYVTHTDIDGIVAAELPENVHLVGLDEMAKLTVNMGLVEWLINKAS